MVQNERAFQLLNEVGAFITDDHFVYTSGRHGSVYVNKDAIYPNPALVSELCGEIVRHFMEVQSRKYMLSRMRNLIGLRTAVGRELAKNGLLMPGSTKKSLTERQGE
jgi:orotate phosphoribosyltransferase